MDSVHIESKREALKERYYQILINLTEDDRPRGAVVEDFNFEATIQLLKEVADLDQTPIPFYS